MKNFKKLLEQAIRNIPKNKYKKESNLEKEINETLDQSENLLLNIIYVLLMDTMIIMGLVTLFIIIIL